MRKISKIFLTGLMVAAISSPLLAQSTRQADAVTKANALLKQMTVDEKIGQLDQSSGIVMPGLAGEAPDKLIAAGKVGSVLWLIDIKEINRLQHIAVEKTRLHIPLIIGFDVIHGYRTVFPVPIGMASSWDPEVEKQAQHLAAEDARAAGIQWTFTPMVDIARDSRWGRIVEGAGEDPYLGSAMARAQVKGFQGEELGANSVLACVKHFAGYGAAEGGRDYDSSYIPEVLFRNVYLPPFQAAVKAGAGSLMSAYMDLNDVPATGNHWLLTDILRGEWGFQGFVVSDAMAVGSLVTHGYAADRKDAAYRALTAGLNMDMASHTFIENLAALVKEGKISEADLDKAVLPMLTYKYELGLFDNPYIDEAKVEPTLSRPEGLALERKLAARSMVLLKNEKQTLPLAKSLKKVAVIGPLANSTKDIEGGWTVEGLFADVQKSHPVTVLAGIKNHLAAGANVSFVDGPAPTRAFPSMFDAMKGAKPLPAPTAEETRKIVEQVKAAASAADVVVAVMGEKADMSSEAASRAGFDLPGIEKQMLEAAVATGKPVVLVLESGRPIDLSWASEHVSAILQAWYPGTEGGNAVADLLFGDVVPGGKLPVSWPRSAGQEPLYYNHNLTHEPEDQPNFTSRYWDVASKPLYPFGYGLSYTSFSFKNLKLSSKSIQPDGSVDVSVDVTNTGKLAGDAVAQIYIHQRAGSASRPVRQLKGFERVALAAGETKTLHFNLGKDELSFWSPISKAWGVEPGKFDLWAGEDSRASLHDEFEVSQ